MALFDKLAYEFVEKGYLSEDEVKDIRNIARDEVALTFEAFNKTAANVPFSTGRLRKIISDVIKKELSPLKSKIERTTAKGTGNKFERVFEGHTKEEVEAALQELDKHFKIKAEEYNPKKMRYWIKTLSAFAVPAVAIEPVFSSIVTPIKKKVEFNQMMKLHGDVLRNIEGVRSDDDIKRTWEMGYHLAPSLMSNPDIAASIVQRMLNMGGADPSMIQTIVKSEEAIKRQKSTSDTLNKLKATQILTDEVNELVSVPPWKKSMAPFKLAPEEVEYWSKAPQAMLNKAELEEAWRAKYNEIYGGEGNQE